MIVLAWVNDEQRLRACGKRADAYATFTAMLENGNPPDNFDALMQDAFTAVQRLEEQLKAAQSR